MHKYIIIIIIIIIGDLHVNIHFKMIDTGGKSFYFSSMNFVTFNLHGFNNGNDFLKDL